MNLDGYKKLISKVLEVSEEDILPLRDIDIATIDRAIIGLGNRYGLILFRRFGLCLMREKETLRVIATSFEVSPERIRQLEAQALTKLRHPSRIGNFRRLTKAGREMQERIDKIPLLDRRVEDFELSARTLNAVRSADVCTLGELARKTEHDIIMIRGFGRKSLFELKRLLLSLGLGFAPDERCRR